MVIDRHSSTTESATWSVFGLLASGPQYEITSTPEVDAIGSLASAAALTENGSQIPYGRDFV